MKVIHLNYKAPEANEIIHANKVGHGQISDQAESEEPFRDNQQAGGSIALPSGINNIAPLKVSQIEGDLKSKSNAYNALKSSLQVG